MSHIKPMLKYRGGKSAEIDQIIPFFPLSYERYIEPFFGGGALYFYLSPQKSIINDLNKPLINFYQSVRNNFLSLKEELSELQQLYESNQSEFQMLKKLTPNKKVKDKNEELYYHLRKAFNGKIQSKYSDAAIYFYINKTAYSGMIRYNSNGEFNVPYGRYKNLNTSLITLDHSNLLKRTQIYSQDYEEIFNMSSPDDFIFLDPPYDCIFSDYGNEEIKNGFNHEDHRRLAKAYKNLKCKALMVVGKTDLTYKLYKDYIIKEYNKNYSVNIRNRFRASSQHMLIANYKVQDGNIKKQ